MLNIHKGKKLSLAIVLNIVCVILSTLSWPVFSQEPDGRKIIAEVEKRLWGNTSQGLYKMTITTPYWQRSLKLKVWMQRPDKSFVRILSPAKEAGIGSLRIKDEMWNYLPRIERTIKIPPSMMLQSWMGSDFTNDDLVKESSMIEDYTHEFLDEKTIDGQVSYRIKSTPKPESAVVWGKIIYSVRKKDFMPLSFAYYDERGRLIKTLSFSDIREMDGRKIPTRWEMKPNNKSGNSTLFELDDIRFDHVIPNKIFSLRNLRGR